MSSQSRLWGCPPSESPTTETDRVEWKRSVRDGGSITRAVCALANDLSGSGRPGFVLVGVREDGAPVGIDTQRDSLDEAQQQTANRLHSVSLVHASEMLLNDVADRPVSGHQKWAARIPTAYVRHVLDSDKADNGLEFSSDPNCIATIKHMASLAPIAQQAHKPMFDLKVADGIGGGQIQAVAHCRKDFAEIAIEVAGRLGLE